MTLSTTTLSIMTVRITIKTLHSTYMALSITALDAECVFLIDLQSVVNLNVVMPFVTVLSVVVPVRCFASLATKHLAREY